MSQWLLRRFVRGYENNGDTQVRTAVGKLSGIVGIICNLLLFGFKIVVGTLSGSIAIAADAMNNLSDATSSIVTFAGFKLAEKPADKDHPYGHARFEYLSGLIVAAIIIVIGFELARTSIEKIIHPTPVDFTLPVIIVLAGSILLKMWLYVFNRKLGRHIDSRTLMATAADSRNDAISTAAVLLSGMIAIFTDVNLDGFFGLAVALFILYSGIMLAKSTISPLLGENASPELRQLIVDVVSNEAKVLGYHDLMVHDYGPGQRFASIHVEMDKDEDPLLCHEIIDNMERRALELHNVHLVIHYDPVVTDDPELDRLHDLVAALLRQQDDRITIHDFRMVASQGHTNLIFDMALPAEMMGHNKAVQEKLEADLAARESKKYYTVITFDMAEFN